MSEPDELAARRGGHEIRHMCMDIQGFIQNHPHLYEYENMFTNDDGTKVPAREARDWLFDQLRLGHRVIPMVDLEECPGFDYQKGCQGHIVKEEDL